MTHKQYAQAVFAARILKGPLQSKTKLTSGTKLEGKHTAVVIGRHVAIRIYGIFFHHEPAERIS